MAEASVARIVATLAGNTGIITNAPCRGVHAVNTSFLSRVEFGSWHGEAEATLLREDDEVVAFRDINVVTPGHLMVVPHAHLRYLADIDDSLGAHVFNIAQRMAGALRANSLRCEGINLFYADGEVAFQEVPHTHLHVLPRYTGDSFTIDTDWNQSPSRDELDRIGARIRDALERL